ncbi:SMP-30/gluconolactonase/LRE family protein [Flammeovirgaceae bacterium SG7u.111]|nr:SMP-30/gluconolactonase/LRE family protein [Flammeovirgaceae bacterium SG7u.132]WPO36063.1 SMP-30/gluconolactonase/LRE family protein [Flammeovirgaceae bacterium SG7u.111]
MPPSKKFKSPLVGLFLPNNNDAPTLLYATSHFFWELEGKRRSEALKVDIEGNLNLYCTGSGGVGIFDAKGKHYLGTVSSPEVATNCAFGGEDGKTLFVTAQLGLYKLKLGKKE